MVSSRQRNKFISMDEVWQSVIERARKMGGDAVLGVGESEEFMATVQSGATTVVDTDPVLSATVIRFTDPSCTE